MLASLAKGSRADQGRAAGSCESRPAGTLLRAAGFARWEIYGDFHRKPLTQETDSMIVFAWRDRDVA